MTRGAWSPLLQCVRYTQANDAPQGTTRTFDCARTYRTRNTFDR